MLLFRPFICTVVPVGPKKKKKAIAQAVTSWNEWLTYKGVSLHVSAQGEQQQDKNTPGSRVPVADQMGCCQMREAKLSPSKSQDFQGWVGNRAATIRQLID